MPSPQPSFARMTAAISIPSSRNSPASTPSWMGANGSLQSTPEGGLLPLSHSSLPVPTTFHLPEPFIHPPLSTPPTSSPSAMAEALSKGPSLIRRVSKGAQGIPNKLRRNGSNVHRDKSSGPVIMRRRSDSRTAVDAAFDVSEWDRDYDDEEAVDDFGEPVTGLGISSGRPSVSSSIPDAAVVGPVRNPRLELGTLFTKVTKKEKKRVTLRLDFDAAKVCWDISRPSKCFYIDDVKDLRIGPDARHDREECGYSEAWAPYWLTIVYSDTSRSKGKIKTMNLYAPDVGTFELWTRTLDSVHRSRVALMAGMKGFAEKSARSVWQREMSKRFGGADLSEEEEFMKFEGVVDLCRNLHINFPEGMLQAYFNEADTDKTGSLSQQQFLRFVRKLKERKDIRDIYVQLESKGHSGIDKETFFAFLEQEQGVSVASDKDRWTAVFDKFARASKSKGTPAEGGAIPLPLSMGFRAFQTFMTSEDDNPIFAEAEKHVEFNRPLNEYFISSSHNTYLLGRQVAGESSTEAYIYALQKGCRCIEIDCWNGSEGRPIVMHGRTFTKSISFLDTVKVINTHAFIESTYPLILSLEVHCNPEQQKLMADIMIAEFGDKLLLYALDSESPVLPSPQQLKGRILVKVKAPAEEQLDTKTLVVELSGRKRERSFSSPWSRPVQLNNETIPDSPLISSPPSMSPPDRANAFWATPRTSTTSTNATAITPNLLSSAEDSDSPHTTATDEKRKKSKTSKIIKELGELGVYTRGFKFSDFEHRDANTYNHVFSLAERTFDKLTRPGARIKQRLDEHNMRCLMRVYPGATRLNSSNFEPLKFWKRGVQMVATNWQTFDLGQQLNEAMFAGGNDRSGYVLKPAELRLEAPTPVIGPKRAPKQRVSFAVEIISAQQLPRPKGLSQEANLNPYVEFEMHCAEDVGHNTDSKGGKDASAREGRSGLGNPVRLRTRMVKANGYNPEWNERLSMTVTTRYPSLVFVRWSVFNSEDAKREGQSPLATFTAKLSNLQKGYRHLPLYDSNGEQYLFSTLFCKIEKYDSVISAAAEPIPEGTGSEITLVEPGSPLPDMSNQQTGRSFLKKLLNRTPSDRKKRKEERAASESTATDTDHFSRASTIAIER
ncbi:1-phosphatidylinositol-4,5-bisphosphate phosphodiesterase 1 [Lophiotrema nucula]|uniref:Phosphoinositide phospholipase C n=1 Tax=Lophiotrema nucula TaxID=690887 RepID=A0A6A5ZTW4_9PLEO|nr:1-phosphatidylinositol-4,5-bisphosphate phosphodiesterase 1 [Lophiotrema nucula]